MTNSQPGLAKPFSMETIEVPVDCATHGPQTVTRIRSISGEIFPISREPECPECCREARERKRQAELEAGRQERVERLLRSAHIPLRYSTSTFDDFRASQPNQARAAELVRKFAEAVCSRTHDGAWLVMSGLPGTGKTLLSAALTRYLAEHEKSVLYTTQSDLAREFRRSYQRNAETSEPELFDLLTSKGVLVIDELGASTSEHIERLLFEICDARYSEQLPTVFATNHPRKDLAGIIGERLYDRMCEVAAFVPFDWASARSTRPASRPANAEKAA